MVDGFFRSYLRFSSNPALAGQIIGELDKSRGNTADTFLYTLSIEGDFSGRPVFPQIDGMIVRQEERSSRRKSLMGFIPGRLSLTIFLSQVELVFSKFQKSS